MSLEWDNSLLIGVKEIDDQHEELFKYLNDFLNATREGKGINEIKRTLEFLENYVIKHFMEEEEIQKKYGYPKLDEQHSQHEIFKKQIKDLRLAFDKNGESALVALNLQNKIVDWVKKHITTLDKEIGKFILEKSK